MKKLALLTICAFMAFGSASADIDNLDIGGDLMAEYFFSNELVAQDSETDFLRTEGHLWFQADLEDNIMTRISLEFDRAMDSSVVGQTNNLGNWDDSFDNLDLFLDEAFVKIADIGGSGFSFSAGRQYLNYGDNPNADNYNRWWGPGFVVSDAAPMSPASIAQLGSYELDPFDALVGSYETEMVTVDAIYARAFEDFASTVNNDSGVTALYGSLFGLEGHQIDLYAAWADPNMAFVNDTYIIGGRMAGDLMEAVAYKLEVAYQFQDDDQALETEGLAVQAGVNYHPDMTYNPNVGFMYSYFEGDNGDGFRALDGKTYGLLTDSFFNGQVTNAHVFNLNGGFEPMEDVAWTADLYYTLLDEEVLNEDDGGFEIDSQIDYRFNDNLRTFLGGGVYWIGDAFGRDDEAFFFRTGMKVNF